MMVHQTKTGMQVLQNKYQEDMIYLSTYNALENPIIYKNIYTV